MRRHLAALVAVVLALILVIVALGLLGRTQLRAEAPPAGLRVTLVRSAGIDLLLRAGVPIGQAPVCSATAQTVACVGSRADGAPIRIDGEPAPPPNGPVIVTVVVDGRVVATAPAQEVVDAAGSAP